MQKVVPNLWFDQNIDQAADFYASALPNAHVQEGFSHPDTGEAITTDVVIGDYRITLMNGGPYATLNSSISFFLNFDPSQRQDAEADLKRVWNALTTDGEILMELGEYPFSKLYGWATDRYGFNWQLMLTNPDNAPRPFIVPSLMFCGAAQGKATEAVDYYTELFDVAALGNRVTYETMGVAGDKNSPDTIPQPLHVAFQISTFTIAGSLPQIPGLRRTLPSLQPCLSCCSCKTKESLTITGMRSQHRQRQNNAAGWKINSD